MSALPRVALLIDTNGGWGRDIVRGIGAFLRDANVRWQIAHEPRMVDNRIPSWLKSWRGDGVIAKVRTRGTLEFLQRLQVPVVDVVNALPQAAFPVVAVDDAAIAEAAFDHLRDRGFRSMAFVSGFGRMWETTRRDAFLAAAARHGCQCDAFAFKEQASYPAPEGRCLRQLAHWLAALPAPLGVMGSTDYMARLALSGLELAGIPVPERAGVIGCDDDDTLCQVANPPLSSVVANHATVGYEAAKLLESMLAGKPRGGRRTAAPITVPPLGIAVRRSTDIVAVADADVSRALSIIRDESAAKLTIEAVAERLATSRTTLARHFRRLVGHGVHEEIIRVRMQRAQKLLAESDLPIRVVAKRTGFEHQEYMGRLFRARLGTTPKAYREQARRRLLPGPRPE